MSIDVAEVEVKPKPERTRARRMFWPVVGCTALVAAAFYVGRVDPNQSGHYPPCPLKAVTGLDCPGCGGLRCVHSLMNGDIAGAADHNLLAVIFLPVVVVLLGLMLRNRWTGKQPTRTFERDKLIRLSFTVIIVVVIIFSIARNLPFVPFLNSA